MIYLSNFELPNERVENEKIMNKMNIHTDVYLFNLFTPKRFDFINVQAKDYDIYILYKNSIKKIDKILVDDNTAEFITGARGTYFIANSK